MKLVLLTHNSALICEISFNMLLLLLLLVFPLTVVVADVVVIVIDTSVYFTLMSNR